MTATMSWASASVAPPTLHARRDAAVRTGAATAMWLGLTLVSYWWAAGGGVRDLGSWADGLDSTGRLTGLVASFLLLVQVILMSRIPVLERAFGQDRLARQHRLVGFTSFNLMLAHLVLITWGYAAGELSATPATLWNLVVDYPAMLLAAAGTVCLVMVVVTSVRAARRRLRYESWHLLHLYAYLGVGLALPHQLWTGHEFLGSPVRAAFWWGLWIAALAGVLVFRVGLPVWRSARHGLRVTSVVPEGDGVVSVYMTGRHLDRLPTSSGQFFGWRFLDGPGWTRANPWSLSAAPDGRSLRITVQAAGDGSARLRRLRPGTRVLVEGPFGRLSARARTAQRVALIGAGVGIAPLRALAEELPYAPGDAAVLYRYSGTPLFRREFDVLARERGLVVHLLPGHRRAPGSWLGDGLPPADDVTILRSWLPDIAQRDVYVCGPEPWTEDVVRTAMAAGVPAGRIHTESFGW
jgi:predicted ferric reductase